EKIINAGEDPRRNLPAVSELLEDATIKQLISKHSRLLVMDALHDALQSFRSILKAGDKPPPTQEIVNTAQSLLTQLEHNRIRPVINATGIILHTGLGRAALPKEAADALALMDRCCNLQIDLETCLRGKRDFMVEYLLRKLTGCEAAMIVNNNAAATFLILSAMCKGKEVIISRGQLIEIGGSYRLPDCIRESGAIMREVGTTNKTHLRDYEEALGENTGAILRCNPSNYRIVGFSQDVPIQELARLKKKRDVLVIDDLGCGALVDLSQYGLPKEPTIQESIAAGADLVCSSGDKLIGGPQAGIILGKKELIQKIKKHPLTRMLRVCKLTDIAMEQTLRLFLEPDTLLQKHPTLRMMTMPLEAIHKTAVRIKRRAAKRNPRLSIAIQKGESATGGGSLPHITFPTWLLAISAQNLSAEQLSLFLRRNEPPIIARIKDDKTVLDMRTILPGEENLIIEALARLSD
ncbi:MAG TPA: L-seryl-tRNA(Sec) selenium transferase, partial [Candidatus Sumerlaeia bacterium]|nr:L-seryl-tRNA(Sec) selenium transferase [Candidatus Sumerlaeia bacterium]